MAGQSINFNASNGPPPRFSMDMPGYSHLGRGVKGFIPQWLQTDNHTYEDVEQQRVQIVDAWNNIYRTQLAISKLHRIITPFRAVTNSGDILSRKYYSCGGPCQTPQSIVGVYGLNNRIGSIQNHCDKTAVPAAACNVKYVYDSSDYSTYLKQRAILKTYNNLSNGGDDYKASQVAWKAIRRY